MTNGFTARSACASTASIVAFRLAPEGIQEHSIEIKGQL
jgi:hypothetical protein